jgi:Winged helix DNA-binding domain
MDEAKVRAWWAHKQGLDGSLRGKSPAETLEHAGWARSVGGVGPYLTIHARTGATRQEIDGALEKIEIHELPSARGCTYVVGAKDFELALKVSQRFKVARKLGVTDKEVDKLREKVCIALEKGAMAPDKLKEAVGGASRNLKGVSTTLPLALGFLQSAGEIRRIPVDGRLDQQRYKYALWKPNPLAKFKLSPEEAYTELARKFFQWIGPASTAEFQWFSGLGVKASKEAIAPLKLVSLEGERMMTAEDRDAFEAFRIPSKPRYALTSSVDGMSLLRRDSRSLLDPADYCQMVVFEKAMKDAGSLIDLPSHAIFDRGRLIGLWEYDTATSSIAWMPFVAADKALKQAVNETEAFVRDQLGDARSFSLDSPKSRAPKIERLRGQAVRK